MLLANYASDSDSGSDTESPAAPPPPPPKPSTKPAAAAAAAPKPAAPAPAKKRKPVKIGLDLPKLKDDKKSEKDGKDEEEEEEEDRSFKKPKLGGAGSSSLLGMLPPPKRKLPIKTTGGSAKPKPKLPAAIPAAAAAAAAAPAATANDSDDEGDAPLMLPAALKRAAAAKKTEEIDLFGLSSAAAPKPKPSLPASLRPPTVSAAPPVADFVPPEPTAADPYPGYYQLPSGSWAAYDPEYYASFFSDANDALRAEKKAKAEREGKAWSELDDGRATVIDYDVSVGLEAGRKEREAQAAKDAFKPKVQDEFTYAEIGQTRGLAAERHQLTSLLSSAFSQREELEARIAQNKKNMRNATAKYGF